MQYSQFSYLATTSLVCLKTKLFTLYRFSGNLNYDLKEAVFDGEENQPFLLYFQTDEYIQGKGFRFSYLYLEGLNSTDAKSILNYSELAGSTPRFILFLSSSFIKYFNFQFQLISAEK